MLDPTTLFSYTNPIDPKSVAAKTLVVTLGSYVDAGHVQTLIDTHLLSSLRNFEIGRFDVDQLLDYREDRPPIIFQRDHFTQYQPPRIALHHLLDDAAQPFLLLTGPEPSMQWDRMVAAVTQIVDDFGIELVATAQGIPAPAPHTRPTLITRLATDPVLLGNNEPMFDTIAMGASFPAVLSTRLGESGHRVVGLAAHIPHYVSQSDYPSGALALIDELNRVTTLNLPAGGLPVTASINRSQIDTEVANSEEAMAMVRGLEEHYDAVLRARRTLPTAEDLPSADQIGAEAEDFLRRLNPGASDQGPAGPIPNN